MSAVQVGFMFGMLIGILVTLLVGDIVEWMAE